MFLNMSNHPVAKWSESQVQAALALGFGNPTDYPMPLVPPNATTQDVHGLAIELLWNLPAETQACHVSGEYTLTYTLVKLLTECGFPCYVATTERNTVETIQPDGSTKKTVVFNFIQWRSYT